MQLSSCVSPLKDAATSPRTLFRWLVNRNCTCFTKDRRTGEVVERSVIDDPFIPRKGKRKVGGSGRTAAKGRHKAIKAAYLGKTLGEDKKIKLDQFARYILSIRGNGFNARYVKELFSSLYVNKRAQHTAGLARLNHEVIGHVLEFLPIYVGQTIMQTQSCTTIDDIDVIAVKMIADHPDFRNRLHWAFNMATHSTITKDEALRLYDQVGKECDKGQFEIWRRLLFILDGSDLRR